MPNITVETTPYQDRARPGAGCAKNFMFQKNYQFSQNL